MEKILPADLYAVAREADTEERSQRRCGTTDQKEHIIARLVDINYLKLSKSLRVAADGQVFEQDNKESITFKLTNRMECRAPKHYADDATAI